MIRKIVCDLGATGTSHYVYLTTMLSLCILLVVLVDISLIFTCITTKHLSYFGYSIFPMCALGWRPPPPPTLEHHRCHPCLIVQHNRSVQGYLLQHRRTRPPLLSRRPWLPRRRAQALPPAAARLSSNASRANGATATSPGSFKPTTKKA